MPAKMGMAGMLKATPELARLLKEGRKGAIHNEYIEFFMAKSGQGIESTIHPSGLRGTRYDPITELVVEGRKAPFGLHHVERFAGRARNVTAHASGLVGVTEKQKKMMHHIITHQIEQAIYHGKLGKGQAKRMAQMGLGEPKSLKMIGDALHKYSIDITDGGKRVTTASMEQWQAGDPKSFGLYQRALFREIDRSIIDVSVGKTPPWMSRGMGRIFGQFMSFTMHSYNTHFLRGMSIHDREAAMSVLWSSFIAGTAGYGLSHLRYMNDPEKLEEKTSIENVMLYGLARSTAFGIPTTVFDTVAPMAGYDTLFNGRYTGLDSNLISFDSTAALSMSNQAADVARRGFQIITGNKRATAADAQAVLKLSPIGLLPSAMKAFGEFVADAADIPLKDDRK